jgi:hypothetical protein
MAGKPPDPGKDARAARLAAALKQNLKRRKAQARGRVADESAPPDPTPERPDDEAEPEPKR